MKKKDILSLIRHHVEKNEAGFRNEAYEIAKDFDASGDYQLSEYIMALLSDANTFVPQMDDMQSAYFEKLESKTGMLLLPDVITQDIIGIVNAIEHRVGINNAQQKRQRTVPAAQQIGNRAPRRSQYPQHRLLTLHSSPLLPARPYPTAPQRRFAAPPQPPPAPRHSPPAAQRPSPSRKNIAR